MTLRARARSEYGAAAQPRSRGRFAGGLRVNCEEVPRLPAWAVRTVLDDPRRRARLLTWRDLGGEIAEAARVEINSECPWPELQGLEVIVSRLKDGQAEGGDFVCGVFRPLPRGGARDFFLLCDSCRKPRRHLYGWSLFGRHVQSSRWECRRCAGLRYSSEGGALVHRSRGGLGRLVGDWREPRPGPWDPELAEAKAAT